MKLMEWATPQQIITNALFDQGYRRFGVLVVVADGGEKQAVIWARSAADVHDFYWARKEVQVVWVTELRLARFTATPIGNGAQYAGDIILADELLDAVEQEAS